MKRNKNVVVNVPSDGLEEEVIRRTDLSEETYKQLVKAYIKEFAEDTACGRMFFNVCYKRSVVHSNTADTYLYNIVRDDNGFPILDEGGNPTKELSPEVTVSPLNRGYRKMLERNIDIIKMAVTEAKAYGIEAWFSVRMNDHHYPDDRGFNSSFAYDRAEALGVQGIGIDGARQYMDYTKPAVQNYYKNYIQELCENYDINGIELDFLRSCPVMSVVDEENISLMNGYVSSVKAVVNAAADRTGKQKGLAVRVYPGEEMNLKRGLDAVQWIADGSIDILTVEGWYIPTWYDIPVEKWRQSIAARNVNRHPYTLLCGTDWGVMCDRTPGLGKPMWLSLEQFKGFASGVYAKGADGLYIFNHFNTCDACHKFHNMGLYSYYIDENGNVTKKRVLKEKMNAAASRERAESGKRCYVHTYTDSAEDPYPITVTQAEGFTFTMQTGSRPPKGYFRVIAGIDDEKTEHPLVVLVNGVIATGLGEVAKSKDLPFGKTDEAVSFVNHVSQTARRVLQFDAALSAVRDGENTVTILAESCAQTIRWLEIQIENVD